MYIKCVYIYCCFANLSHDSLSIMSIPFRRPHWTPSSGGRVEDIEPSARTKAAGFRAGQGSPKSIGVDSDW